jgi:hypothetical protein
VATARADAGAFEVQRRLGDRPSVAFTADEVGGIDDRVVEEDLVEHGIAGHLAQRADGHAGLVEREGEPRDALVLRHGEVGAGEEHPVVARAGHAAPHLLAVDDEAVTVTFRARGQAGEVGAGARLAEELAPVHLSVEDGRHEPLDLVRCAVGQDRGRGHQQTETAGGSQRAELGEGRADGETRRPGQAATALFGGEVRCRPTGFRDDAPPVVDREVGVPVLLEP